MGLAAHGLLIAAGLVALVAAGATLVLADRYDVCQGLETVREASRQLAGIVAAGDLSARVLPAADSDDARSLASAANAILDSAEHASALALEDQARLSAVLSNAAVGIAVVGQAGTFENVNARWAEMLGCQPEDLVGQAGMDVINPDDLGEAVLSLATGSARDVELFHIEARLLRADSAELWADLAATGIRGNDGELTAVVLVAADITERRRAEAKLDTLSRTDPLTGLPNRRAFEEALEREWLRAKRLHEPVGVLLCDVDHFKSYNDTYGHLMGDCCLVSIGDVLRSCFRDGIDWVARWGGEEFAAVIGGGSEETVEMCAERLRKAIVEADLPRPGQIPDRVTVSVGCASRQPDSLDGSSELLDLADKALYRAKSDGRNRVALAESPAIGAPTEG